MVNKKEKLNFNLDFLGTDNIENEVAEEVEEEVSSENVFFQEEIISEEINVKNNEECHDSEEKITNDKNSSTQNIISDEKPINYLKIFFIVFGIFILIHFFNIIDDYMYEQKQIEIQQTEQLAYEYKKTQDPLFYSTVSKLARLTDRDGNEIIRDLQQRFDDEKKQFLEDIVDKKIETGHIDNSQVTQIIQIYFNNDKKIFEDNFNELFNKKKKEILEKLVEDWQNESLDYEENKKKYLKTLFNDDISLFNIAMDEILGYKEFTLVKNDLPSSGVINIYSTLPAIAPFKISLKKSASSLYSDYNYQNDNYEHYYVKLVDFYTNKTVVTIFVRAEETIDIDVPLGSYKLRYATGQTWYGEEDLFGHNTNYYSSDELLSFRISGQYVEGHTLNLYKIANGNFSTKDIKAEEF